MSSIAGSMSDDSDDENQNQEVVNNYSSNNVRQYNQAFNTNGHEQDEQTTPAQNQRRRTTLQPMDNQLANHPCFSNRNIVEVSLSTLRSDEAVRNQLNFKYLNAQILRIITSNQSGANVYSCKRLQVSSNMLKFQRLFLCRIHSENYLEDNNQLVYIMEARNQNLNLWSKNINQRDNGSLSIGSFIRFLSPLPITTYMRGDIPILNTHMNCILLKIPNSIRTIAMNEAIEANESYAFVYNNVQLNVNYSAPIKTTCTGKLCDRQRVNDWLNIKGCGCYGMSQNSSSLVMQHSITMTTPQSGDLHMDEFSSLKFQQLYMKGDIPGCIKLYMLIMTEASITMLGAIDECIELINNNGGFTITGWYKRGSMNDKGLIAPPNNIGTTNGQTANSYNNNDDSAVQVGSGELSYHVVSIIPMNRDFFDRNTPLGTQLNHLKFDPSNIESTAN